jgi:hypothetical protein
VVFAFAVAALVVVLATFVVRLDERLPAPDRERVDPPLLSKPAIDWAFLNMSTRVGYTLANSGSPRAGRYDHQLRTRERAEHWPHLVLVSPVLVAAAPVPVTVGRHRRPEPPASRTSSTAFEWLTPSADRVPRFSARRGRARMAGAGPSSHSGGHW